MAGAKSVECRCGPNLTCKHCLQNPFYGTLDGLPGEPSQAKRERAERYRQYSLGNLTVEEFERANEKQTN
jgi:hypothetical protein